MIPIRDENPTRTTPYIVYFIIILNVLAFVVDWMGKQMIAPHLVVGGLFNYSMIPAAVVTGRDVVTHIGPYEIQLLSPHPTWITIFTSMFLHGGFMHIAGNMWFLWIFGNNIEDVLGHFRFALFYLIGGVAAALAHIFSGPMSTIPTVGASGAIAAVMGAYVVLYPRSRITTLVFVFYFITTVEVPALFILSIWLFLQMTGAIGSSGPGGGGVAYWAHIGGFVAGVIGILLLGGRNLKNRRPSTYYRGKDWHR